jgi:BlaI family penicillinase repressor
VAYVQRGGGGRPIRMQVDQKRLDYKCDRKDHTCGPVMKKVPKISDTEWEIMRVVWANHPITAAEIVAQLVTTDASWHPKTARTLLARLVEKKALTYSAEGRVYVYEPAVTEAECVAVASGSFVERVFGGSLRPMLAHFVEQRRLTRADLDELRKLLEEPPATKRERIRKMK